MGVDYIIPFLGLVVNLVRVFLQIFALNRSRAAYFDKLRTMARETAYAMVWGSVAETFPQKGGNSYV